MCFLSPWHLGRCISWKRGLLMKNDRYLVDDFLGDGTFGRVLLARDTNRERNRSEVAIKVIRNVEKYTRNAQREAEILKDIRLEDGHKCGCVRLHETFFHEEEEERFFHWSARCWGGLCTIC